MDISQQKEQFSNAYLQAVVSVAGYSLYKPSIDNDSVDWGIAASSDVVGSVRAPRLEVQLKSTSREALDKDTIRYPLKLKNYNDLRMPDFSIPRILLVVLLPDKLTDWLKESEQELCLRYCGYWISLNGMPKTLNTTAVTVSIPRTNQFTVAALKSIIQGIASGVKP